MVEFYRTVLGKWQEFFRKLGRLLTAKMKVDYNMHKTSEQICSIQLIKHH